MSDFSRRDDRAHPFLSVEEIREMELPEARKGGLDAQAYELWRERVAVTFEALLHSIDLLTAERAQMVAELDQRSQSADQGPSAARVLSAAQRTADALVEEASAEAAAIRAQFSDEHATLDAQLAMRKESHERALADLSKELENAMAAQRAEMEKVYAEVTKVRSELASRKAVVSVALAGIVDTLNGADTELGLLSTESASRFEANVSMDLPVALNNSSFLDSGEITQEVPAVSSGESADFADEASYVQPVISDAAGAVKERLASIHGIVDAEVWAHTIEGQDGCFVGARVATGQERTFYFEFSTGDIFIVPSGIDEAYEYEQSVTRTDRRVL